MSKLVLAFSMSLDGFVAGPGVSVDEPMGKGGEALHDWIFQSDSAVDKDMAAELARPSVRYWSAGGPSMSGSARGETRPFRCRPSC